MSKKRENCIEAIVRGPYGHPKKKSRLIAQLQNQGRNRTMAAQWQRKKKKKKQRTQKKRNDDPDLVIDYWTCTLSLKSDLPPTKEVSNEKGVTIPRKQQ